MQQEERLMKILLSPHVSEKGTLAAQDHNQYVFKVLPDATKLEIKAAVKKLFNVAVKSIKTVNVKGKVKRVAKGIGKRKNWKKAYVTLADGQSIDLFNGQ